MSIALIIAIALVVASVVVAIIDKQWRSATYLAVLAAVVLYVLGDVLH